jgi:hypothetical protein
MPAAAKGEKKKQLENQRMPTPNGKRHAEPDGFRIARWAESAYSTKKTAKGTP